MIIPPFNAEVDIPGLSDTTTCHLLFLIFPIYVFIFWVTYICLFHKPFFFPYQFSVSHITSFHYPYISTLCFYYIFFPPILFYFAIFIYLYLYVLRFSQSLSIFCSLWFFYFHSMPLYSLFIIFLSFILLFLNFILLNLTISFI